MNKEESMLDELTKVRPEVLDENALKLFNEIMDLIDERDILREKYNKALDILLDFDMPCEIDDFNTTDIEWCSKNCSNDEETFKKCWNRYIEWKCTNK